MFVRSDTAGMSNRVLVLATGGTIASTAGEDGATPTERGRDLLPPLPSGVDVEMEQVAQVPSPDMGFDTVAAIAERAEEAAADDRGVVVLHGTDTMEETAYYVDAVLDGPPVVFTGAQRRPDRPSPDGPANVADAVSVAADSAVRAAGGAYVLLNGELHAARDVTKTHTWKLESFASPGKGPVGHVSPAGFEAVRELGPRAAHLPARTPPEARVEMVKTAVGVDGTRIDRLVADAVDSGASKRRRTDEPDGSVDGVVLEATGLGNAPKSVASSVGDAVVAGVPVVVTSRCQAGRVAPVYGSGGGRALADAGAAFAGDLSAQKARIKLMLALALYDGVDEVRAAVERDGGVRDRG